MVGTPDYLLWSFYFYKKDIESGYISLDKSNIYKRQEFQKVIYSLNQPWLKISQSAYTNWSLMDREYYKGLFGGLTFPNGTFAIDFIEEFMQYQEDFLEFIQEERRHKSFTFPVLTASTIFKDNDFVDNDFFATVVKHNMEFADINIYKSENADALSSCCFDGEQEVFVNNKVIPLEKAYEQYKEQTVETIGLEGNNCKVIKIPRENKSMYEITMTNGTKINATEDHLHPTIKGDIQTSKLKIGDFILHVSKSGSISKRIDNNYYLCIKNIRKIDNYDKEYVYCLEMVNQESPYFVLPSGMITHNCRMEFDTKEIKANKLEGNFNSIGGTDLNIGSSKCVTVNLPRLSYLADKDEEDLMNRIEDVVTLIQKFHKVHRHILQKNIDRGLLPLFQHGLVSFDKLFATIGITGLEESVSFFDGLSFNEIEEISYNEYGLKLAKKIVDKINNLGKDTVKKYGYTQNCEQVPAESLAIKLLKKDKLLFGEDYLPNKSLYSNQWIGLSENTDISERIRVAGILDKELGGGAILHLNIGEKWSSFEDAYNFNLAVARAGVKYWSEIRKIKYCANDHNFFGDTCPICGEKPEGDIVKIVGYLTKDKYFKSERYDELQTRVFYDGI